MSTPHSLIKRLVVTGVLLSCCSFAIAQQADPQAPVEKDTNGETTAVVAPKEESKEYGAMTQLLASNLNYKDTTLVTNFNKAFNEFLDPEELTEEDLMYPSLELYGEDSWNSSLNPISGTSAKAKIPAKYEIDLKEFVYPLDGLRRINSNYGYRRRFGRMHYGIDIDLNRGDTIRAAFSGKVRLVQYDRGGYGYYVLIRHANGLETLYGHMSRQLVKADQIVRAGDAIGLGGSTGRSTGPHLHFETRFMGIALNPSKLIDFASGAPIKEQYLYVKSGSTRSGSTATSRDGSFKTYRVRKGDTLSGIASKTGTTVSRIRKLNPKLRNTSMIHPGDVIRISA